MYFSAIEGFGGVPPIRPLETLHNALSLRQIDIFLERMTAAPLYRTPSSTPPKYPSTPLPPSNNEGNLSSNPSTTQPHPLKLQSPCNSKYSITSCYNNPLFQETSLSKLLIIRSVDSFFNYYESSDPQHTCSDDLIQKRLN